MQNIHNEYELKYHKNYHNGRILLVYGSFLILKEPYRRGGGDTAGVKMPGGYIAG